MKKLFCIFVMLFIVLNGIVMMSCSKGQQGQADDGKMTEAGSKIAVSGDMHTGERPLITITDYNEYSDFMSKEDRADKIIGFDAFKPIGNFKNFVILSEGRQGDYSQYKYGIDDGSGFIINLTVTDTSVHKSDFKLPDMYVELEQTDLGEDLRYLNGEIHGYITVDGVELLYVKGKLLTVRWMQGDIEFKLNGNSSLAYPDVHNTFISELLRRDKLAEQIEKINKGIQNSY